MDDRQGQEGEQEEGAGYYFEPDLKLTFGEMEARLALLHEISSEKRTQFQARLRNFQNKHGIPYGAAAGQRGKTVYYSPGQVVEMALALELTQLGLLPERIVAVFELNKFPISQAVIMAALQLQQHGGFRPGKERADENLTIYHGGLMREGTEETDPMSMFLYFDPTALAGLTDIPEKYEDQASATFFYGGAAIVRENIVKWTAGPYIRRLSLINVTALLWELIRRTKPENQTKFLKQVEKWGEWLQMEHLMGTVPDEEPEPENIVVIETPEDVVKHAELLKGLKGLPRPVAEALVARAQDMIDTGERPGNVGLTGKTWADMDGEGLIEEVRLQLIDGGLPEFVAEEVVEAMRSQQAEHQRREAAGLVALNRIVAEGLSVDGMGRSGKPLRDMTKAEFAQELERRRAPKKPFNLATWLASLNASVAPTTPADETPITLMQAIIDVGLGDWRGKAWHSYTDEVVTLYFPGDQRLRIDGSVDLGSESPSATIKEHAERLIAERGDADEYAAVYIRDKAFLDRALEEDRGEIVDWAFERKVLLAVPSNLRQLMETAADIWAADPPLARPKAAADRAPALVEPDKKPNRRKAKKHGDR